MTTSEIIKLHTDTVLNAIDTLDQGTQDSNSSLVWLLNLSESWVDQSALGAESFDQEMC